MANDDDFELQEALRRSLEQTNLQESQLADALAESVRTHDHEIARTMHLHEIAQIEGDSLTQTRNEPEDSVRSMEAELLSSQTTSDAADNEWQVVGQARVDRPRYDPFHSEKERKENPFHCPNQVDISTSSGRDPQASPASVDNAIRDITEVNGRAPYRPPNLYLTTSSSSSQSEQREKMAPQTLSSLTKSETKAKAILTTPSYERNDPQFPGQRQTFAHREMNEPLVVIDGQNVGCSYGGGGVSRFRAKGVEVVLDFYFNQGIPAVAIVPRHKVDTRSTIVNDRVADDPELLTKLEDQGRLAFTPAGVHDDHFVLSYAMSKGIDIISNDRFQKEISEQETPSDARKLRTFLNEHLIPYTFIHGQFVPNPKQTQLGRSVHHSRTRHS